MKRFVLATGLGILMGCTAAPPVLQPVQSFRDPNAQIASQTDVTAARMAGHWFVRQSFASADRPASTLAFSVLPNDALQLSQITGECVDEACLDVETLVLLQKTGPGRWTPDGDQDILPDAELWVMWMDFDSRTAVIGNPSGSFGWIMDKNDTGGGDRIAAARDIMDWFGYNTASLIEVSP